MAIIGQSKNEGLYQKVTEEGSKYRELKYADLGYDNLWNGQPVLHGYIPEKTGQLLGENAVTLLRTEGIPPVDQNQTNIDLKSDVLVPVTARIDDTERITRLLTKVPGIKWEAHTAELEDIQNKLERKRGQYSSGTVDQGFWSLLGGRLLEALKLTGTTLAQVAVAGTGMHFSSWISAKRSYIGDSAAAVALSSGNVTIVPDRLQYHQLPTKDNNDAIVQAKLPEFYGSKVWYTNSYGDGVDQAKNYLQQVQENGKGRYQTYGPGKGYKYGFRENTEDLVKAQQPSTPKSGDFLNASQYNLREQEQKASSESTVPIDEHRIVKTLNLVSGSFQTLIVTSSLQKKFDTLGEANYVRGLKNTQEDGPPNLGQTHNLSFDLNRGMDVESYSGKHKNLLLNDYFASGSRVPTSSSISGPWKHDGAHALKAGSTGGSSNHAKDGGQSNYDTENWNLERVNKGTRVDNGRIDMIPFWIRALSPDGTLMDRGYLFFEANLDSYSDNYDATWESTQYIGRADKFWTYSGFDRQISFSFKMVAHTKSHLKPVYNRLNGLLSMTTPSYDRNETFMQGVLAEVTIGDLLDRQLGFIKSVGLKWETDYMWEIDKYNSIVVPHVLDVSIGFTPIHQFIPKLRQRYFNLVHEKEHGTIKEGVPTFTVTSDKLYKEK